MNWKSFGIHSLKTRVAIFTLAIFVISIWSLSFFASQILREDMQRQLGDQQLSIASLVASQLNDELKIRLGALKRTSGRVSPALLGSADAIQTRLNDSPALLELFNAGLVVVNADGTAIASLPRSIGVVGVNLMDREHIVTALKEGKATIGRPVMGKKVRAPIVVMAVPIFGPDDKVIGAITGLTDLSKPNFLDQIVEGSYGKTGGFFLVAPKHRLVVTASDKTRVMESYPANNTPLLIEQRFHGREGSDIFVNPRGVEVLSTAKSIPVAGWYFSVAMPTQEAFAPIRTMQQRMLLATILFTLLVSGLIWWLLKHQLAPMLATVNVLAKLSATGEAPHPIPAAGQDEIADLIGGFNTLLEALAIRDKALSESTERWRFAIEGTGAGVLDWDIATGEMQFSDRWLEMTGYARDEIAPRVETLTALVHPDDFPAAMADAQMVLDGRKSIHVFEHRLKHKDGHWLWIQSRGAVLLRGAGGEPLRMIGTHLDVTEHKQAEAALRESEQKLRNVIDGVGANTFIGLLTPTGEMIDANRPALDAAGLRHDDVINKPFEQTYWWAYSESVQQQLRAAIVRAAAGEPSRYEVQVRVGENTLIWIDFGLHPVRDAAGRIVYLVPSGTVIEERKQAEARHVELELELRESQKMQAVGTLAGGIAHDFNNIIATVLGNAELASQDAAGNTRALESLEQIAKAARRGRELVRQILSFSRRQPAERKPVSLAPIIEEATQLLHATLPARMELQVQCAPDVPAVNADVTQIEQVIINLATNALQAMQGEPGCIGILLDTVMLDDALVHAHPALRTLGELHPGPIVRLSVSDNGPGMDEATLSRIFEPFFTTKAVNEGTGLGLAVVHGIVEGHEGVIEAASRPGEGAVFTIYLPAAGVAAGTVPPDQHKAIQARAAGGHILYLDDDESLVFLVKRLLERRGYRVSDYVNQDEALAALRADPAAFDLIVTDYNMPGMSGLDVAIEVQAIRADLPVAVASGFIDENLRDQAGAAGVCEVIFKADAVEDFCDVVQRLLLAAPKKSPA